MEVKKILFVTGSMNPAGAEKQLYNLIYALHGIVPDIYVACFAKGPMRQEYVSAGAEVMLIDKGEGSALSKVRRVWQGLRSVVEEIQPDLVHSQLPQTNILSCFSLWSHSVPLIVSERGMGKTRPKWEKILRHFAYRRPDGFITNSHSIANRMINREKVSKSKIQVIRNSINIERPIPNARMLLRSDLNLSDIAVVLTSVGGLRTVKGYEYLLNAFAKVISNCPDLFLIIAGDGPEKLALENTIQKLRISHRVQLLGRRNDIASILAASDIFVSSSQSEGQSNAILEAMAFELPVIATAVGGTPEIIENDVTGMLVQSENILELSKAITELYCNQEKRRTIGFNAKEEVLEKYTLKGTAQMYYDYCKKVCVYTARSCHNE